MKKLLALLLALCMLLCCGCAEKKDGSDADEAEVTTQEAVDLAPTLNVYDREGNPVSLTDMKGKRAYSNAYFLDEILR